MTPIIPDAYTIHFLLQNEHVTKSSCVMIYIFDCCYEGSDPHDKTHGHHECALVLVQDSQELKKNSLVH